MDGSLKSDIPLARDRRRIEVHSLKFFSCRFFFGMLECGLTLPDCGRDNVVDPVAVHLLVDVPFDKSRKGSQESGAVLRLLEQGCFEGLRYDKCVNQYPWHEALLLG